MKNAILSNNSAGPMEIDVEAVAKSFQDTRKHKRYNRIVADSFITFTNFGSNPTFRLVNVKNGQIETKIQISEKDARTIIEKLSLTIDESSASPFGNATTWRTAKGCETVRELLLSA